MNAMPLMRPGRADSGLPPTTRLWMRLLGTVLLLAAVLPAAAQLPQPPVISPIPDQTLVAGVTSAAINFTVTDPDSSASSIKVSAAARDPNLIPAEGISLTLGRVGYTLRLTSAPKVTGKTVVTVAATDGRLTGTQSFTVTIDSENTPPSLSDTPDQVIPVNGSSGPLPF